MGQATLYKTKPLDCWQRAKELRVNYYKQFSTARQEGRLIASGSATSFSVILAGLGDYAFLTSEPYGASIATDPEFSRACAEIVETKGFARDMCAYMRNYWGSMYLDRYFYGGQFPKPDLLLQAHYCDSHAKWFQVVTEYLGVPYRAIDLLPGPSGARERARVEYIAGQLLDAIEWLEKVTGRKYDDGRLVEAARIEFRNMSLWAEICTLNKAIPAPLDEKSMYSLYVLNTLAGERREVQDFYETLRDEVRDRVANGIAALATERCRILADSQPPWYFLQVFRYMEQYGAVCVGSAYSFALWGAWEEQADGTLGPMGTPDEKGMSLKTREDVARALAAWWAHKFTSYPRGATLLGLTMPEDRNESLQRTVKEWHAQGVIMHLNRGCEGSGFGQMENRLALVRAGIPIMTYEGNMGDEREFDKAQTIDRLEAFMESLGLSRITE